MGTGNKYAQEVIGTLDLHGYTIMAAIAELSNFLESNKKETGKHLKIITGKGLHSPSGSVSIRDKAKTWLTQSGYQFRYAKINDGGEGALIVQIK